MHTHCNDCKAASILCEKSIQCISCAHEMQECNVHARNSDTFGIITLANMNMSGDLYGLGGTTKMLLTELANNPSLCGMVPGELDTLFGAM